jgi:NAD(P)-dependent dehydrogenase (short-subunit alcohol dehydrogenase family)
MYAQLREASGGVDLAGQVPQLFQKLVTAQDVAAVVAFLLGDESKLITKAEYTVDCGFCG